MKLLTQSHHSTSTPMAKAHTLKTALAAAVLALSATAAFGAERASTDCGPQYLSMRTDFPAPARYRNVHGVVRVDMKIDANGRVTETNVTQSSGHILLDRAAINSIRKNWRFDVSQCSTADLEAKRRVTLQFLPPIGKTLADPIIRKAAETTQDLLARNRCEVVHETHDTIYSCIADAKNEMAGDPVTPIAPKQS